MNDMLVEVIKPVIMEIAGPISFGGRVVCFAPAGSTIIYTMYNFYL